MSNKAEKCRYGWFPCSSVGSCFLALMYELIPLLKKLAQGREISGLGAYEQ